MKYAAMITIMILTIGPQALAAKNTPSVVDSVDLDMLACGIQLPVFQQLLSAPALLAQPLNTPYWKMGRFRL